MSMGQSLHLNYHGSSHNYLTIVFILDLLLANTYFAASCRYGELNRSLGRHSAPFSHVEC